MDTNTLWWTWSLVGAGVVVVVVAVLLGLIFAAARSVDRHARGIWIVGKQIAGNTVSIWLLEAVKERLERSHDVLKKLDKTAASLNENLRILAERKS